ncbi:MAG: response regulator [Sideroxydans sp.]|nr:response regulator [Sideroxydans sp.]
MAMTILLADDHALFRDGMRYVLQQLDKQVDILDASSFPEALQQVESHPGVDLALMDLNMPGSDGAASVRIFHLRHPEIPLVVVSGSDQRDDIERVMEFGAMGFVSKMSSGKVMLSALRMVLDGGVYLPPQLLQQTMAAMEHGHMDKRSSRSNEFGLTVRQMEVLRHLAEGKPNKDIAREMNLAEGTIKIHVAAVFQSLHVNSRLEAVRAGQRLGLLQQEG